MHPFDRWAGIKIQDPNTPKIWGVKDSEPSLTAHLIRHPVQTSYYSKYNTADFFPSMFSFLKKVFAFYWVFWISTTVP